MESIPIDPIRLEGRLMSDNTDQQEFWSGPSGQSWVRLQAQLDGLMQPVLDGVLTRAGLQAGDRVLDIGCGTGASTVQAGQFVGLSGHVCGLDIAAPMLDHARSRAGDLPQVAFLLADAADHPFVPESYDRVISRFGVMFFADPVGAFRNIRAALCPGAAVTFAAWAAPDVNPWFTIPALAAKAQLGAPPPVDPDEPGPFAFRNPTRVRQTLTDAGFADIRVNVTSVALTPSGTRADAANLATFVGPATRAIRHFNGTDADREAIAHGVVERFAAYDTDEGLRIPATINYVTARNPG